jgi:3-oxoacyl-[acyl-carrier protein] reductase
VNAYCEAVDVRDTEAIRRFTANTRERLGRVDVCVANAGGPPAKEFVEASDAEWQSAFEMNLRSTIAFARELLPGMQQQRWGRIVTITSLSVKQPLARLVLSNTIRGAIPGLIRTLSNEYARDGITVNNVAPGYTATTRLGELAGRLAQEGGTTPQEIEASWTCEIPAGRLAKPEEIADAIVWLASERAAYITGQTLLVDGGMYKGV